MKTKDIRNNYNPKTLQYLKDKYGLTLRYVRASINRERNGIIPTKLRKEYEKIEKELAGTLNKNKNVL
ncbi:MAG: hypothetical protein M9892_12175 [Bacteroidetes bacterium]|nr:hypothetical protein [Bacteroidota bacterium]